MAADGATPGVPAPRAWLRGAAWLLGLALGAPLLAQPIGDREMQVEAAFLVNFVRYAEWPAHRFADPDAPYVIAVVDGGARTATDTIAAIARAAGPIQGRRIEVRAVDLTGRKGSEQRKAALARLRASHLAFLPSTSPASTAEFLAALEGSPVLTVGDAKGFVAAGGMLGLVRSGPRVAFEANPEAIQAGGLGLSAKVLKLARIRQGRP